MRSGHETHRSESTSYEYVITRVDRLQVCRASNSPQDDLKFVNRQMFFTELAGQSVLKTAVDIQPIIHMKVRRKDLMIINRDVLAIAHVKMNEVLICTIEPRFTEITFMYDMHADFGFYATIIPNCNISPISADFFLYTLRCVYASSCYRLSMGRPVRTL